MEVVVGTCLISNEGNHYWVVATDGDIVSIRNVSNHTIVSLRRDRLLNSYHTTRSYAVASR